LEGHSRAIVSSRFNHILFSSRRNYWTIDFVHDFAVCLPIGVIAQLLGVPKEDRKRLRAWSRAFGNTISRRPLSPPDPEGAQRGVRELFDYFHSLIMLRKKQPSDDMLGDLIALEEDGERLSTQELTSNLVLLLAAGHGTTSHQLAISLLALWRHPDQWHALCADPSLIPGAIPELMRFEGAVQATSREARVDMQIAGKQILKGDRLILLLGSANRDEEHFPGAESLDVTRSPVRPVAFGHGIHACLGAGLAGMELQVTLHELARRFPKLQVMSSSPEYVRSVAFRGLQRLVISLK
jgi:cytochrome P450